MSDNGRAKGLQMAASSTLSTIKSDYVRHRGEPVAFLALLIYRFGKWTTTQNNKPIRWVTSKVYGLLHIMFANLFKIWLPAQVTIGEDFHIIHASGHLAIHPDVIIGHRCGVMHNVTIGGNMSGGVPRIGDDVFIGTGAVVIGPIKIGDRVRIGANAVVTTSIPADAIVQAPPPRVYKRLPSFVSSEENA